MKDQKFACPTVDKGAKYLLTGEEDIRIYILGSLTGIQDIDEATVVDQHLQPLDKYGNISRTLRHRGFKPFLKKLYRDYHQDPEAKKFLQEILDHFEDIKRQFDPGRNSQVDFICKSQDKIFTVEFQASVQDYWDQRALSYLGAIYGNQQKRGDPWVIQDGDKLRSTLIPVIGINILGDPYLSRNFWKEEEYSRHYVFYERKRGRVMEGMELYQYALKRVELDDPDLLKQKDLYDTLRFFKNAHEEQEIPENIHPALRKAYEMMNVERLKKENPTLLKEMNILFSQLHSHDQEVREVGIQIGEQRGIQIGEQRGKQEGKLEGKAEVAKSLLVDGMSLEKVSSLTGLSIEKLKKL